MAYSQGKHKNEILRDVLHKTERNISSIKVREYVSSFKPGSFCG